MPEEDKNKSKVLDLLQEFSQRLTKNETEIHGIHQAIRSLGDQLTNLAKNFNANQKTPWPILLGGASLIVGILSALGALSLNPIQQNVNTNTTEIHRLEQNQIDISYKQGEINTWKIDHNQEFLRLQMQYDDLQKAFYTQTIQRLEKENETLRANHLNNNGTP